MDPGSRLRQDFLEQQQQSMARSAVLQRRNRLNGAIGGGVAGLVGTAVSAAVTRSAIAWHSFLLEALLCTLAGYLLARRGGGILTGALLFSGAYLLAFQLRAHGLDPGVLFNVGDLRQATATQGHLMTMSILMACGGAFGSILES